MKQHDLENLRTQYKNMQLDDDYRTTQPLAHFPIGTTEANILDWLDRIEKTGTKTACACRFIGEIGSEPVDIWQCLTHSHNFFTKRYEQPIYCGKPNANA
jgi:hypothetical protein